MQRKLLALAVAGAFAVPGAAIAQVTISGAMRYSVDNAKYSDGSTAASVGQGVSKWGLTGHSANIKFQSRENLGGGLTAWMALENGFAPGRQNGANFGWFGRNSGLGLESTTWGVIMMGQWDSPYKSIDGAWSIGTPAAYSYSPTAPIFGNGDTTGTMPNPNCTLNSSTGAGFAINSTATPATACSYVVGSSKSFQRRLSNTVQWWSPVWNGVQLQLATQTNDVKTSGNVPAGTITKNDPSMWSSSLRWTGPRWALVGGYEQHKNFNTLAQGATSGLAGSARQGTDRGWKIGGNYDFGPVAVSLAYEDLKYELGTNATATDEKHKNWALGGAFPIGNGAIRGIYAKGKVSGSNNGNLNGSNTTSSANGKTFNLSYEYAMSKRTLLYVAYHKMDQDKGSNRQYGTNLQGPNGVSQSNNAAGTDVRYWSFGMNHNF